jgi:hypothetical protein
MCISGFSTSYPQLFPSVTKDFNKLGWNFLTKDVYEQEKSYSWEKNRYSCGSVSKSCFVFFYPLFLTGLSTTKEACSRSNIFVWI